MCNAPGNFLLTYDPQLTELHSDTTDFEDSNSPPVTHKNGNHSLLKKKVYTKYKKDLNVQTCSSQGYTAADRSSKEMWESQTFVSQNGRAIDLEVHRSYENRKSKTLDGGDQIETIKSKRSLIRHKVIPCLSNMFGWPSNNVKQMSIIKENQAENANIDNGRQATRVNGEHRMRKLNRKHQCYAVKPVYAVEENIHAKSTPIQETKILQEPLSIRKTIGNDNFNVIYSLTSSSEGAENQKLTKRKSWKNKKSKHTVEPDMGKDHFKHYEGSGLKHRQHKQEMKQCHSKPSRKSPYQVFTTQYQRTNAGCSPSYRTSGSELPSTCSGFWEYLFTKLNMKYQTQQATGKYKPCKCNASPAESIRCSPTNCAYNPSQNLSHQAPQTYFSYPTPPCPPCDCGTSPTMSSPLNLNQNVQPRLSPTAPPLQTNPTRPEKIECKCYPGGTHAAQQAQGPPIGGPSTPIMPNDAARPCQLTHADITATLSKKYNGEILCIHNPPCVLINGCLNLPPTKQETSMNVWPVTQSNRCGYHQLNNSKQSSKKHQSAQHVLPSLNTSHNQCQITDVSCQYFPPIKEKQQQRINDESCQYQIPSELKKLMIMDEACQYYVSPSEIRKHEVALNESCQYSLSQSEIQKEHTKESFQIFHPINDEKQLKTTQPKKEKIVQSICNHNPPCEVVRTCCKKKIDPKLQNSCVHVPMCEKVPVCLMELKSQNKTIPACQHKPKCAEVPICTRNFIVLTAKEEVATQVRPKTKMVCRHEPPCIMIPSCLARLCDGYIPCDAIPDCIHQPMCEMIPACCRKSAKGMVSVCSQYPNQCCVV